MLGDDSKKMKKVLITKEFIDEKNMHMHLFYTCCKCGYSVHLEGVPNNYYHPQWFLAESLIRVQDGVVCQACGSDIHSKM